MQFDKLNHISESERHSRSTQRRQNHRQNQQSWRGSQEEWTAQKSHYQLLIWKLETSHIISFNISPFKIVDWQNLTISFRNTEGKKTEFWL